MNNISLEKLETLEPLITAVNDSEITAMSKFLYERIKNPDSYIVFLGETSSGKSSIIDGLLNEIILPVKASPSTAAITEVELSENIDSDEFYAINKNASIEKLDKSTFLSLCEQPDKEIERLKLKKKISASPLRNLRIFDTPGYGSIVAEHEEILKNFLPNSDIIVYTVNYKIGIQEEDFVFLNFLKELIRDDVEIILVINRCPIDYKSDDKRIFEIKQYVSDILSIQPTVFCIKNIILKENEKYALPQVPKLWNYVSKILNSEKRIENIQNAFNQYIIELYHKADSILQCKYAETKMSDEETTKCIQQQNMSAAKIRNAINELIIPTFKKITDVIPEKFDYVENAVYKKIEVEIDSVKNAKMDEMVNYTNVHLLPYTIRKETNEIQNYIEIVLEDLNQKVDDYISKEIENFNTQVSIILSSNIKLAAKNIVGNIFQKFTTNGLGKYFLAFGGAGGANAGIANAASHLLKKFGDLFGKTFSRETHNALKHFLAKIGANSMKAIGSAIAVIAEVFTIAYDYATWKNKLKKKVRKGLAAWKKDTVPIVINDLNKLKEENINTINNIANELERSFDIKQSDTNVENYTNNIKLSAKIAKQIGA